MKLIFQPIAHSWVAHHPEPIGMIEFLGGALYGTVPILSYRYFLHHLYQAGYSIMALPFPFGFDHESIAYHLLEERDRIRTALHYPPELPHFWVGHSLGCKYIALLEAYGAILDQPSLLLAPDISDTQNALPIPALAAALDRLDLGVHPTRQETQTLIRQSGLFNLTALISFSQDEIAGNQSQPSDKSDVAWFAQELDRKPAGESLKREIPGGHREPIGLRIGDTILRPEPKLGILESITNRQLERVAIELLAMLAQRLQQPRSTPSLAAIPLYSSRLDG